MAKQQKEKPRAEEQHEKDNSAQPSNAGESLRRQPEPRERGKGSRRPGKSVRTSPTAEKEGASSNTTSATTTSETTGTTATTGATTEQEGSGKPAQPGKTPPEKELRPLKATLRKRRRLAEALRRAGLDERAVAETYVVVVERLRGGSRDASSALKLLVDVLKECCRILEPSRASGAGDVPAVVNLYHNVPRPVRDLRRKHGDEKPL